MTRAVNQQPVTSMAVTTPVIDERARQSRGVWSTVLMTARQLPAWRLGLMVAAIIGVVALVVLVPMPTAVQLRDWASAAGPWFPVAFLLAHVVVTVLPFPRTAFTLAAGLLFGPWLGVVLAVLASALSALAALLLMRGFGWQLNRLVRHPKITSLDARLRQRGWPAVVSLRLIPAVPFSVINYAAGASAVRVLPYTLATVVGMAPGTAAVVILGDALTGHISPLLYLVSVCTAGVGLALLAYEVRSHRRSPAGRAEDQNCTCGGAC